LANGIVFFSKQIARANIKRKQRHKVGKGNKGELPPKETVGISIEDIH